MNERIRDLQIQAFAECKTFEDDKVRTDDVFERFAKLIVEECVNLMENQKEHYYSKVLGQQSAEHYDRVISKGDAFDDAVTIIRAHFRS